MRLHEAIVEVLSRFGRAMSASEVADEVNKRGLHARGDMGRVPPNQISAHVSKHPELFKRENGLIMFVMGGGASAAAPVSRRTLRVPKIAVAVRSEASPNHMAPIADLPFREVGIVGKLLKDGLPKPRWLDECGVYALILPSEYAVSFLPLEDVVEAGNVISPWSAERLGSKWVANTAIAYIGLAGDRSPRSLRKRLRDLIRHAAGKTSENGPHKGGEILWQLANYTTFEVRAMPTEAPPAPRDTERALLSSFVAVHNVLPFANRQG